MILKFLMVVASLLLIFWQNKSLNNLSDNSVTLKKVTLSGLNGVALNSTETATGQGQINLAYQSDPTTSDSDSVSCSHDYDSITHVSDDVDEEKGRACRSGTHSIVLDISTTSLVDTVSVKTLKNVRVC